MNESKLREDMSYLAEYSITCANARYRTTKLTAQFWDQVFDEDSAEEMLETLTKLGVEYRIMQNISSSARGKINAMISDLKGELK